MAVVRMGSSCTNVTDAQGLGRRPWEAATHVYVDDIIDPAETRQVRLTGVAIWLGRSESGELMGVGQKRRDGKSQRKSQIITSATSVFYEKGYHESSLDDIADRVGFTKPAIYYYFNSKDDILFAIVDSIVESALNRILDISRQDGSAAERLHDLLAENTRVILENLEGNTVFYNSRGFLTEGRERDVREREREYTRVVRALYVEGVQAGELLDIDPTVATSTLLGASIWAYRWFAPRGKLSREQVARDVATLLMNGFTR